MSDEDRAIFEAELEPPPPPHPVNTVSAEGFGANLWRSRILDGRAWLSTGPMIVAPLWGDHVDCLAAVGQPTYLVADFGVGKTTLAQHILLGAVGSPDHSVVLGWPVRLIPDESTVLYLAADRPEQARLSMLRLVTNPTTWDLLEKRLRVLPGPPPADLAAVPTLLRDMAADYDARLVVIDSAKDVARQLEDPKVGSPFNGALQLCVADERDVFVLHHPRKRSRDQAATRLSPDDMYGSQWLAAGAGSIIFLTRQPTCVDGEQVKSPNGRLTTFRFRLDVGSGEMGAVPQDDVLTTVLDAGDDGIATSQVARAVLEIDKPTEAQVEQIRRRLAQLREVGLVEVEGKGRKARWVGA